MILSIDPGLRACGVALFLEATNLLAAGWVRSPSKKDQGFIAWKAMAEEVWRWYDKQRGQNLTRIVVEIPGAYGSDTPDRTLKVQNLVGVGTWICATSIMVSGGEQQLVRPRDWKGTIDPDAMCARAWNELSPLEKDRVVLPASSYQHNVKDAIGLGLWATGRLSPKRVIARE